MSQIFEINDKINKFILDNPESARNYIFDLRYLPIDFRNLTENIFPPENVDKWFVDKDAFNGKSALDKLSELNQERLRTNVKQVAMVFYEALSFLSVGQIPSVEKLFYETRLAQAKQLGLEGRI